MEDLKSRVAPFLRLIRTILPTVSTETYTVERYVTEQSANLGGHESVTLILHDGSQLRIELNIPAPVKQEAKHD